MKDFNNNPILDEQIDLYLANQLEGEPLQHLLKMIQSNDTLQEEIAFRRNLNLVLHHKDSIQFSRKVGEVMAKRVITPDASFKWNDLHLGWKIFGASIIIAFIGWLGFQNTLGNTSQSTSLETFLETNTQHFENKLNLSPDGTDDLTLGLNAYNNLDYPSAIRYLSRYTNRIPLDIQPQFYLGMSHLMDNQPQAAIPYFQNVVRSNDELFYNHALWHLGLAQLKAGDSDAAKITLANLREDDAYGSRVKELLVMVE